MEVLIMWNELFWKRSGCQRVSALIVDVVDLVHLNRLMERCLPKGTLFVSSDLSRFFVKGNMWEARWMAGGGLKLFTVCT